MEQRRSRRWLYLLLMVTVALGIGIVLEKGLERTGHASETYEELRTFSEVLTQVQKHYVDDTKVKDLVQGAIRGMLSTLDPHSAYMTPEMYKEMQVETKGEFGGVGIQIGVKENRLAVISPIEGTPAHRAGIKAGDFITKVNDEPTKDLTLMDAVQKMRGPKGTKVNLTIQRDGTADPLAFSLVRDTIKIESVKFKVLDNIIGYVRLTQFQEATGRDLSRALKQFKEQKVQGTILDLRNNPGGLLTAAVDVSEQFVGNGKLIVYTKGREGKKDEWFSKTKETLEDSPMIILMNEGSASASAISPSASRSWCWSMAARRRRRRSWPARCRIGDGPSLSGPRRSARDPSRRFCRWVTGRDFGSRLPSTTRRRGARFSPPASRRTLWSNCKRRPSQRPARKTEKSLNRRRPKRLQPERIHRLRPSRVRSLRTRMAPCRPGMGPGIFRWMMTCSFKRPLSC